MHLLTVTGTAVSVQKSGLLPLNQFGITFTARSPTAITGFRPEERTKFVTNLGDKRMMFLRNHGTLTHGRSIAEAFILMHNLERSCEIQIAAQSGGRELVLPPDDVIKRTVQIAQGVGDQHFAEVGFDAVVRQLNRIDPTYRD